MQYKLLPLNILSYLGLVIINFLAIQLPFFGKTPGDVSDLYPNLLTPADFAFKIWSVIYLLLGLFVFCDSKLLFRKNYTVPNEVLAIGQLFALSCILNVCWLITWQSLHISWSFISIFLLWLILIWLYSRLAKTNRTRWFYTLPISVYLAWVCIAALANLNVLLLHYDFTFFGLSDEYWTAGLIGLGIGGTLLVLYLNQDIWFTIVLIWAFFGIYKKNVVLSAETNWVIIMSITAMISLSIIGLWVGLKKWRIL